MAIYKTAKMAIHAIIIGLLLAILVLLIQGKKRSGYANAGAPLTIQPGSNVKNDPKELFDIKPNLDCVPGPSESADYYTMGLTPGGLCGGSKMVADQMRDFTITDGISGSLLQD
jgi:hypothetical protein